MKAVFIVGAGRSGTHFTARSMNGFAAAHDPLGGREHTPLLRTIARAAIHHRSLPADARRHYQGLLSRREGVLIDQHHPNLFFLERLRELFDALVFVYPRRPAVQVVASMMRHPGVMAWYRYASAWRQRLLNRVPFPNRFLGLRHRAELHSLPVHPLCAQRVMAHRRAFLAALGPVQGALRAVDYEALVRHPAQTLQSLFRPAELAALGPFHLAEQSRPEALDKYRDVLDAGQVADIEALERRTG